MALREGNHWRSALADSEHIVEAGGESELFGNEEEGYEMRTER
jgi:hypothetical protein